MAAGLNALFDKRRLALTRARLRAWWEGVDFDEAAAMAAVEASLANNNEPQDVADALFDEPEFEMPARLAALSLIWGPGRVRPGDDTADKLEPARIGIAPDGVLAFLGPGLSGPVAALASAHPGKIDVYEWREESFDALKHGVRKAKLDERVNVTRIDLEAHVWQAALYDGLLSVDDFAYVGFPPHLAHQLIKCLKPGACAVIEAYVGLKSAELATAFASSFAEPQIRAHSDVLQYLKDVGFVVEGDEDLTEEFLEHARAGFKRLGGALAEAAKLEVAVARELAWEAEAWRTRMKLLAQRRLERRRIIVRRPTEGPDAIVLDTPAPDQAAEKANTPAA
ncbi:hypothetical protein U91I_03598 [alpha proteobacterium U9-1i]|nr:hypothetical protein U91I_03598 [alpha proteobacterium U9-1i]